MVLRIHFTGADLARTRISREPDALWELMLSLHRLRRREETVVFGEWKKRTLVRVPAAVHRVTPLAPSRGYAVDFLTPRTETGTLAAGLENVRRTPGPRLLADLQALSRLHPGTRLPGWTKDLAAGSAAAVEAVAVGMNTYFDVCLSPYWSRISGQVGQDHALRSRILSQGGWEAVFSSLHPSTLWAYPVLELAYPAEHDIHLNGRGLVLQPSFFCRKTPVTLRDQELPPILVYPIAHDPAWAHDDDLQPAAALAQLLGPTRARVLELVALDSCTTSELARRLDLPPSTASRHVTTLREAGLATSQRHGQSVLHAATALGAALLNGHRPNVTA